MTNKPTYKELEQRVRDLERAESDRKQAEEALRESQQFLSRVINENPFPIWIGDSKGTILQCNQALLDLLQLEEHQLVGKYNILKDPLIENLHDGIRNIFDKGETWTFEVQWQAQPSVGVDSSLVVIAGVVFPIFNQKGEIVNLVATYHDITEQKKAQNELKASLEQLKNLTKHLQSVREQERTKIARELHDELGQVLTAINLGVYAISNNLPSSHQHLTARAEATAELAVGAIKSVKRIISELRPTLLEDLGLDEAVRYHIREYQSRCTINFFVLIEPEGFFLDYDLSVAVFRIFQEAITNAVRHSNATSISVNLKKTDTGILLKVRDNGIGIRKDQLSQNGSFGIRGMKERAEIFGGTVEISGVGGQGTTLVAEFPV